MQVEEQVECFLTSILKFYLPMSFTWIVQLRHLFV